MRRTIAVVTVARSDYGIYLPILRTIEADPELTLRLIVAGSHLVDALGLTVREIEADGFLVADRVDFLMAANTPEGTAKSMGLGVMGYAQSFARDRPDLVLLLGDRPEMHAAGVAALPFTIPVAHVHGGELTLGAIDDALRHSLTKLSHLHFTSTQEHADRIVQMGEESWRITVSGAPALDRLRGFQPWALDELQRRLGIRLDASPLLVTFHPVTLESSELDSQCDELFAALEGSERPIVFTASNADAGGRVIDGRVEAFVRTRPSAWFVRNAGNDGYFNLMAHAAAMVGNSSSGLIESPSFRLPVVNIGTRQEGRLRARNVIDVAGSRDDIRAGLQRALAPDFRAALADLENPYGSGQAARLIVDVLRRVPLDGRLLRKRFVDIRAQVVSDRVRV